MSLPTAAEIHYEGCHCADICACSDPIECIHEECICDRLTRAYEHGKADEREQAAQRAEAEMRLHTGHADWLSVQDRDVLNAIRDGEAAARGEDEGHE